MKYSELVSDMDGIGESAAETLKERLLDEVARLTAERDAALRRAEAAIECVSKKCVHCSNWKGWETCKEAAFVSDGEVCLNFQWRDPCAENRRNEK